MKLRINKLIKGRPANRSGKSFNRTVHEMRRAAHKIGCGRPRKPAAG